MGLSARIPQLAIALTVVASVVGYLLLVQNSQIDRKHLSALVAEHTGVQTLKPTPVASELVAPAKSEFTEVKKAWSIDPSQTGGYWKERSGSTASGDAATQLVEVPPRSTQASLVRSDHRVLGHQNFEGGTYLFDVPLHLARSTRILRSDVCDHKVEHHRRRLGHRHRVSGRSRGRCRGHSIVERRSYPRRRNKSCQC